MAGAGQRVDAVTAALVTGGGVRLGRAFATALARDGWPVVIHCNRSTTEATRLAAALAAEGCRATVVTADLADDRAVAALVTEAAEPFGPLTLLVNNASTYVHDTSATLTPEGFRRQLGVNLLAPLVLTRDFAAQLPADAVGNVINVLDQEVEFPLPDFLSYKLSKTGLATLTRLQALELAPRVRVNAIAPGLTLPSGAQSQAEFEAAHPRTPLGRGGTPADLVLALRYLLAAPAVTAQVLYVDGGARLEPRETDPSVLGGSGGPG